MIKKRVFIAASALLAAGWPLVCGAPAYASGSAHWVNLNNRVKEMGHQGTSSKEPLAFSVGDFTGPASARVKMPKRCSRLGVQLSDIDTTYGDEKDSVLKIQTASFPRKTLAVGVVHGSDPKDLRLIAKHVRGRALKITLSMAGPNEGNVHYTTADFYGYCRPVR